MKKIQLLLGLALLMALISCKKDDPDPVSKFTFSVEGDFAPVTLSFNNLSENSETWLWNFGDGKSSIEKNPQHIYTNAGQYTITLEADNGSGGNNTSTQYITIIQAPSVISKFEYSVDGDFAPVTLTFNNLSENSTSWLWNFGDSKSSTEKNPQHIYTNAGHYTITLKAANASGGEDTTTKSITVLKEQNPIPIVGFSYAGVLTFAPCKAAFTNTTQNAVSYYWDFGDGTNSTQKDPLHIYLKGGIYNVVLTAMNIDGATASKTKQITVGNAPTRVKVKQLTLLSFPEKNSSGSSWDIGSAADPYFEISDYPQTVTYYKSEYFTDLLYSHLPKTYAPNNTLLNDVNANCLFSLKDDDGIWGSENMGEVYFKFNSYMSTNGSPYPNEITITDPYSANGLRFKIAIEWKP